MSKKGNAFERPVVVPEPPADLQASRRPLVLREANDVEIPAPNEALALWSSFRVLAALGAGPASATEVARRLGITRQHAHRLLRDLTRAGLVGSRRCERALVFSLTRERYAFAFASTVRPGRAAVEVTVRCGPALHEHNDTKTPE